MARIVAFRLDEVATGEVGDSATYAEFLRVPDLSVGIYRIPAGAVDPQSPHTEAEVYFVVSGRARFEEEGEAISVGPGSVIFVAAGRSHRFRSVEEDLLILVLFAPAEGTNRA